MVTGASGFVGRYVVAGLRSVGHEVLPSDASAQSERGIEALDITDADAVAAYVAAARPEACLHLAGIAFVPDAARNPGLLTAVNVDGAVNVARALQRGAEGARMRFVSSSQVYGYRKDARELDEDSPLAPASPYAQSKCEAEQALRAVAEAGGVEIIIARPGNHTGPGQSAKFVVPSFMAAIREVRAGRRERITVGNLESERDFTDVRDVVAAYMLLLESGLGGMSYNISSGIHLKIGDLLGRIAALAEVEPVTEVAEELYRPTDATPYLETTRLRGLGWAPQYDLATTLREMWAEG